MPTFVERLPQTRAAMAYAERMHGGQRRADGTPFILHPVEVASLLYYSGAPDPLIAAGVMHDLIEKSDATPADLRERFGPRITGLVLAVSDDDRIAGYAKRKAALRQQVAGAGDEALTLFAADKLSKLRELRRETVVDSTDRAAPSRVRQLRARRLRHYQRSLAVRGAAARLAARATAARRTRNAQSRATHGHSEALSSDPTSRPECWPRRC
jgi:(p)ppGpp synthase/HD superfamily hydrolase